MEIYQATQRMSGTIFFGLWIQIGMGRRVRRFEMNNEITFIFLNLVVLK